MLPLQQQDSQFNPGGSRSLTQSGESTNNILMQTMDDEPKRTASSARILINSPPVEQATANQSSLIAVA